MPPQAPLPTQIPTSQPNPAIMALLRQRAMAGSNGLPTGPAPNAVGIPGAPTAPPAPAPGVNMARPGQGTPPQQMMKAAAQAQSPMQDPETRASAKDLIMKLMKHM